MIYKNHGIDLRESEYSLTVRCSSPAYQSMSVKFVPFCAYRRFANEAETLEQGKKDWERELFEVTNIVHKNYLAFEIRGEKVQSPIIYNIVPAGTTALYRDGA